MKVYELTRVNDKVAAAFERLIPQLSASASPPSKAELEQMVSSPISALFIVEDEDGEIMGTLTLALYGTPTGIKAWIEDVVVDSEKRGKGAGKALIRAALHRAAEAGAPYVNLTSRPERKEANLLYQRIGFTQRKTNVYRIKLKG